MIVIGGTGMGIGGWVRAKGVGIVESICELPVFGRGSEFACAESGGERVRSDIC